MTTLFEAAAGNPTLLNEIVDAIRSAASTSGITLAGATQFVKAASENATFKAAVESRLSQIASSSGFQLAVEAPVSSAKATAIIAALESYAKDNPTQIPISMPIALLFVAAALIFVPSVFKSTGATLFGDGASQAVEGVDGFK
jgi:intracellular multiplication protein IcmD